MSTSKLAYRAADRWILVLGADQRLPRAELVVDESGEHVRYGADPLVFFAVLGADEIGGDVPRKKAPPV